MPARRPDPRGPQSVAAVLRAMDAGQAPGPDDLRTAARYLLQLLAAQHPGRVLEVRIPPVAAVQCLPGPVHTRGTPPNVVETDPVTWVRLAPFLAVAWCFGLNLEWRGVVTPPAGGLVPEAPPPREACGVFGVWAPGEDVAKLAYYGLSPPQPPAPKTGGHAARGR